MMIRQIALPGLATPIPIKPVSHWKTALGLIIPEDRISNISTKLNNNRFLSLRLKSRPMKLSTTTST
jgi:hypothetical protein